MFCPPDEGGLGERLFHPCQSSSKGADTPEEVTPQSVVGVKVCFIPEYRRAQNNKVIERTLIDPNLSWIDEDEAVK